MKNPKQTVQDEPIPESYHVELLELLSRHPEYLSTQLAIGSLVRRLNSRFGYERTHGLTRRWSREPLPPGASAAMLSLVARQAQRMGRTQEALNMSAIAAQTAEESTASNVREYYAHVQIINDAIARGHIEGLVGVANSLGVESNFGDLYRAIQSHEEIIQQIVDKEASSAIVAPLLIRLAGYSLEAPELWLEAHSERMISLSNEARGVQAANCALLYAGHSIMCSPRDEVASRRSVRTLFAAAISMRSPEFVISALIAHAILQVVSKYTAWEDVALSVAVLRCAFLRRNYSWHYEGTLVFKPVIRKLKLERFAAYVEGKFASDADLYVAFKAIFGANVTFPLDVWRRATETATDLFRARTVHAELLADRTIGPAWREVYFEHPFDADEKQYIYKSFGESQRLGPAEARDSVSEIFSDSTQGLSGLTSQMLGLFDRQPNYVEEASQLIAKFRQLKSKVSRIRSGYALRTWLRSWRPTKSRLAKFAVPYFRSRNIHIDISSRVFDDSDGVTMDLALHQYRNAHPHEPTDLQKEARLLLIECTRGLPLEIVESRSI